MQCSLQTDIGNDYNDAAAADDNNDIGLNYHDDNDDI